MLGIPFPVQHHNLQFSIHWSRCSLRGSDKVTVLFRQFCHYQMTSHTDIHPSIVNHTFFVLWLSYITCDRWTQPAACLCLSILIYCIIRDGKCCNTSHRPYKFLSEKFGRYNKRHRSCPAKTKCSIEGTPNKAFLPAKNTN